MRASEGRGRLILRRFCAVVGVRGRLEVAIWMAAAVAVAALLVASREGVGSHVHGLLLAVPFALILLLTVVRRFRRGNRAGRVERRPWKKDASSD